MKTMFKKKVLVNVIASALLGMMTGQVVAATVTSAATATVTGHAPTLTAGQIAYTDNNANGVLDAGDEVHVDAATPFVFADADGDTAIAQTYSWKVDGTEVATTDTYTIVAGDAGKAITLEVVPHTDTAVTDPADGVGVLASTADGTGELPVAADDDVIAVTVTGGSGVAGAPVVADVLTANPTCTVACGTLNYQWQIETAVGSGTWADIAGATASTYTVLGTDQRKQIQVVVSN